MSYRKYWAEGARAYINGSNFSMNPYAPGPHGYGWNDQEMKRGSAWAAGYWWADKNYAELNH